MARTPKTGTQRLRDDLTAAAARLREVGSGDLATAIDTVLAPGGWTKLRAAKLPEGESATQPNVAVRMLETERDQIRDAADESGDILTHLVEAGFRDFLAGDFEPRVRNRPRGVHAAAGAGKEVSLNVTPNSELVGRVKAYCEQLNKEGRRPKLTASTVARAALQARFRIGLYAPEMDAVFEDKPAT